MILDEKNREKLINLVKKDLKENPYNKNTEALLKKLDSMKSEKIYEKNLRIRKIEKEFL